MKTRLFNIMAVVFTLLFIVGCGYKYEVSTVINRDGSCTRTFIVTAEDSIDNFFERDYPIPIDSTWSLTIENDTNENGDTVFKYLASKQFESVEQLNETYNADSLINREVKFQRKFRWFNTFLIYKETYYKLFDQPSLDAYLDSVQYNYAMLSDDDQENYLKENFDSLQAVKFDLEAESGFHMWIEHTIVRSCFDALKATSENIDSWEITELEFDQKRDSILSLLDGDSDIFDKDDNLFAAVQRVFELDSILFDEIRNDNYFKEFEDRYIYWDHNILNDDYTNYVKMPDLVIETNGSFTPEENMVQWNVNWIEYFTDDYEMVVTSRIKHEWALWGSGVIIIFLLFVILLKRSRKQL